MAQRPAASGILVVLAGCVSMPIHGIRRELMWQNVERTWEERRIRRIKNDRDTPALRRAIDAAVHKTTKDNKKKIA
jgi:hypothetical protein